MSCKELNINMCGSCAYNESWKDGRSASNFKNLNCLIAIIVHELKCTHDIRKYLMSWFRPNHGVYTVIAFDITWLDAAIRNYYPQYVDVYDKMLVLK